MAPLSHLGHCSPACRRTARPGLIPVAPVAEGLLFARGDGDTPDVYVHVNPVYGLYHFLVHQAMRLQAG